MWVTSHLYLWWGQGLLTVERDESILPRPKPNNCPQTLDIMLGSSDCMREWQKSFSGFKQGNEMDRFVFRNSTPGAGWTND